MTAPAERSVRSAALPFDDPRHLAAAKFLVDEAYLLDAQRYEAWLGLLTDDVQYRMPVRVSTGRATGFDTSPGMDHFAEDRYSIERRVHRFSTEHAWTEDPPSRLRHHVTNIRTSPAEREDELFVESAVLLFRSRGDVRPPAIVSAGREDVLRASADGWRLARREVFVDESVLRMQNLAVFL